MRDDLIQRLFSLFTSADRAEAIAGDLIQERSSRGSRWFWRHALATAATLCATTVARAPLRTSLVAAAGCALMAVPVFAGVAAVSVFPTLVGAIVATILAIFWWGGALWAGASMVLIAPARGMAASVTLAALAEAMLLAGWVAGLRIDFGNVTSATFYVTAAVAAWPLLIGAAVARARVIAWTNRMVAQ
jgi:hypothetical protein